MIDRASREFRSYVELYERASLLELGSLADQARWQVHPENVVTYIIDRNINYTNVCVADCKFCAFYRRPKHGEGYVLSFEQIGRKIDELKALGGVQILIQGGHNPYIPFAWYLDLMRYIKRHHPIHIHGFSPSEVDFFAGRFGMSIEEVIRELMAAGLDSIPGGGGEILVQEVRDRVAKKKAGADRWLEVMETAHRLGLKTSVTMMYGLGETLADRVEHLFRVREVQGRSGGFTAFICWPLQPEHTELAHFEKTDAVTYLRTQAIARIVLDNVPNIQASWVTMGPKIGQVALRFGANDFGSLMMEENVVSAAGTTWRMTLPEMQRLIADAGYVPRILCPPATRPDRGPREGRPQEGLPGGDRRGGAVGGAPRIRRLAHRSSRHRRAVRGRAVERARRPARHGASARGRPGGLRRDRQRQERRSPRGPHPQGVTCGSGSGTTRTGSPREKAGSSSSAA